MPNPATPIEHARRPGTTALIAASVVAGAVLVVALSWFLLGSVDLGYHVAYGRRFLDTGKLVDRDPFIYAARDYFFVNANWAWQVLVAFLERHTGLTGLVAVRVVSLGAAFGGAVWIARRRGASWWAIGPMLVLAGMGAYERFDLRPELASYALGMMQICIAVAPPRRVMVACAATFVVQAVWVNSHSYFIVGPLATAALLVGDGAAAWWFRRGAIDAEASRLVRLRAALVSAQLVACIVNPWGLKGAVFPIETLRLLKQQGVLSGEGGGPWADISEFKAPLTYFDNPIGAWTIRAYLALLVTAGLGLLAALRIRRWGDAAAIALLAAMSFSMRRNVALFAIAATPLAIAAICAWAAGRPRLAGARRWAALLGAAATIATAVWFTPRIYTGRFYSNDQRVRMFGVGYSPVVFPFDACAFIRSQPALRTRFFTDFYTSSNVLPHLPAGWQVYIDTNTFAYPPEPMAMLGGVSLCREPYESFFEEQGINVVLLHPGAQTKELIGRLEQDPKWALVHVDFGFVVFVRRIPEHASVIAANHPMEAELDVSKWEAEARRTHLPPGYSLALLASLPLSLNWDAAAAQMLRRAVELEPSFAQAWQNLGTAYGQLAIKAGRRDGPTEEVRQYLLQAKQCFEWTLRLDPKNDVAKRNLKLTFEGLDSLR